MSVKINGKPIPLDVAIAVLVIVLVLITLGVIYAGFVLATLWGWFIAPLGAPAITIAQAVGVGVVVAWFNRGTVVKAIKEDIKKDNTVTEAFGNLFNVWFFVPTMSLLFGWIVSLFV